MSEPALKPDALDALMLYLEHDRDCIRSQFNGGRPTGDGGYEQKFGKTWYRVKPVDESPKCDCGLQEALDRVEAERAPSPFERAARPAVLKFALAMEAQLQANDHKPGWSEDSTVDLWHRLKEEADELLDVLLKGNGDPVKEAADVANFAMMIAENALREESK